MAKHEFGIMPEAPRACERFDDYDPWKYEDVITVDNDYIEAVAQELVGIQMYAHTIDVPCSGLAYCGITLIPPDALERFLNIIAEEDYFAPLSTLLQKARQQNKYVIHFGL